MKRKWYSNEGFDRDFKVGDKIAGWSTDKVVTITAIGVKRFLAIDSSGRETVCAKSMVSGWAIVPEVEIKIEHETECWNCKDKMWMTLIANPFDRNQDVVAPCLVCSPTKNIYQIQEQRKMKLERDESGRWQEVPL